MCLFELIADGFGTHLLYFVLLLRLAGGEQQMASHSTFGWNGLGPANSFGAALCEAA